MTILEAMSYGKPCVVTDVGGNPEIVEDRVNGFVTKSNDVNDFAAAIIQLLSNDVMLQEFSDNSTERFTKLFSIQTMMDNYHTVYKKHIHN